MGSPLCVEPEGVARSRREGISLVAYDRTEGPGM